MATKHTVYIGDARDLSQIQEQSVNLVITSPPYWQLKDYDSEDQIGFNDSYEDYINSLNQVWQECARVLTPGCRLCINIGDQFARSVYYGRYKVIPIRTEIIRFCETVGLDYMGAIIWQKVTTCNTTGGASIMGSFPYPRNGILKLDYEFILLFKKPGQSPKVSRQLKEASRITKDEWNTYFQGHWYFSGAKQNKHVAVFPEELPSRLIKMFSFVGETILDPFAGSGTTAIAASHTNRNSISVEINPSFVKIIRNRFQDEERDLFSNVQYNESTWLDQNETIEKGRESLPYQFHDPIPITRKTNPQKLTFGSRISHKQEVHQPKLKVTKVITPEKLRLSNDLVIRLLGIRCLPSRLSEALDFLSEMTLNKTIELKFDAITHDDENNLLAYLYLANKTFINAHLIKRGLADVDQSIPFKHLKRFQNYQANGGFDERQKIR